MKVEIVEENEYAFDFSAENDARNDREAIREAIKSGTGIAATIIECTDVSYHGHVTVTEDDGKPLWAGWLDGRDEPTPDEAGKANDASGVYRERDKLRQALQGLAEAGNDEAADYLDQIEAADDPLTLTPVQAARIAVAEEWQPRVDALRDLAAEIITRIEQIGVIGSKNDEWRERAGIVAGQ